MKNKDKFKKKYYYFYTDVNGIERIALWSLGQMIENKKNFPYMKPRKIG